MKSQNKKKGGLQATPPDKRDFQVGALFTVPSLSEIPDDFELKGGWVKDQEADGGDDFCSAYAVDGASELQEGIEMWPLWGFAASKEISGDKEAWGQNLRDALKRAVKYGSVPKSFAVKVKDNRDLKSYPDDLKDKALAYKKQTFLTIKPMNGMDLYDSIRATMYRFRNENRAVVTGVVFGWPLKEKLITTIPKDGFGHAMFTRGWKDRDYAIFRNSYGKGAGNNGEHLIHRDVVNHFAKMFGAYVLVDMPREQIEHMLENGIKAEDNWIIKLVKTLTSFLRSPILTNEEKNYLIAETTKIVENKIATIVNPRERLLEAAKIWLGKDASPKDNAPDDLACAESVSTIIRSSIAPDFPICLSTADLKKQLSADKRFKVTLDIKPGNILVSPTGSGNGKIPNGHTGVFLTSDRIASNDSRTGKWEDNYSLASWIARYRTKGGYPLIVFEPI